MAGRAGQSVLRRGERVFARANDSANALAKANVKTKLSELSHLAELSGTHTNAAHTRTDSLVRSEERGTRERADDRTRE